MSVYRIASSIYKNVDNLGIGTTNPTHKLHIYTLSSNDNDYESAGILLDNATQGEAAIAFRNSNVSANGNVWVMGLNSNSTRFDIGYGAQSSQLTDALVDMCIDVGGNVGIGTTIPLQKLHVEGTSYLNGAIITNNNNINVGTGTITANGLAGGVITNSTSTTSSTIAASATAVKSAYDLANAALPTIGGVVSGQISLINTNTGPALKVTQIGNQPVAEFSNSDSGLAMRIVNSGNVGIGTTNPVKKLDVNGDINFNGNLYQNNDKIFVSSQWTSNNAANTLYYNDGNVAIGKSLTVEGTITTSNIVVLNAYSTDYQIAPIRKVTYVDPGPTSTFVLTTNGYFGGVASNVHVFVDNNKLTYYSDTINDYQLAVAYDYGNDKTNYTVTLTNPAVFGNLVDITVWPKILKETLPNPMRLYQYVNIQYTTPVNAQLQVTPIRKVFYVESASQSVFDIITPGIYGGTASNIQVFVGQSLLSYYNSTIADYTLDISYGFDGTSTMFTITLTNPVEYANLVDITIWPTVISGSNMAGSIYQNVTTTSQWQNGNGSDIYYYTTGNVGIGTTNPMQKLDIQGGNAIVSGSIGIGTTTPIHSLHVDRQSYFNGNVGIGTTVPRQLFDLQGGNAIISGNVGIGTVAPEASLHVRPNTSTTGVIINQVGTGSILDIRDGGVSKVIVDGSGNVGIGTTIATSMLTINGQTTVNTNTPSVTWISGHSNYNYTIAGNSYNTSNNGSRLPFLAPMAIVNNGDLYIWGSNLYGQLNNGSSNITIVQSTPLRNNFGALANKKIVAVAGSLYHSAALDDTGALYTWGNNAFGQLGIAGLPTGAVVQSLNIYSACNISGYGSLLGKKITAVSCGPYSTLALDSTGQVHAWGSNYGGTLGFSNIVPSYVSVACNISSYGSLNGRTIVAINKDDSYASMALDNTGQVHIWGDNSFGKLGFGSTIPGNVTTACNISIYGSLNGRTITAIAAGGSHYIALDSIGQVHTWGCNYSGQLGFGATPLVYSRISCNISVYGSLNGRTIASINAGNATSYAIDTTGQLHGWGNNSNGELGLGVITSPQLIPINISAYTSGSLNTQSISALSATYLGAYGFDVRGNLHTLGGGYNGIGTTITQQVLSSSVPTFKKNKMYLYDNTIDFEGAKISSDNYLSGIAITTRSSNVVVVNNDGTIQTNQGIVMNMNISNSDAGHSVHILPAGCQLYSGSAPGVQTGILTPAIGATGGIDSGALYSPNGTQYHFWRTYINLVAGTYSFRLLYGKSVDRGIVSVVINGISYGTIDMYSASSVPGFSVISGISIATTGVYRLELQVNSRNVANTTGYYFLFSNAGMVRTS